MNKKFLSILLSLIVFLIYPMNCFAKEIKEIENNQSNEIIKFYNENALYLQSNGFFFDVIKGDNKKKFSTSNKELKIMMNSSKTAKQDFKNFQFKSTLGLSLYGAGFLIMLSSLILPIFIEVNSSTRQTFLTSGIGIISGGAIISIIGICFMVSGKNDFMKSLWKYNKEILLEKLNEKSKLEKQSNNIKLLNYSFKF